MSGAYSGGNSGNNSITANAPGITPSSLSNAGTNSVTQFSQSEVGAQFTPDQIDQLNSYVSTGKWAAKQNGQDISDPKLEAAVQADLQNQYASVLAAYQSFSQTQMNNLSNYQKYQTLATQDTGRSGTILTGSAANPYNTILGGATQAPGVASITPGFASTPRVQR